MIARAALLATAVATAMATAAHAFTAQDAADCAAFSYANWDYEVENFDPADRSTQWKDQAAAFGSVATRMGLSDAAMRQRVAGMRPAFLKIVNGFIFSGDPTAEAQFQAISRTCDTILDTAPEMAPHR